MFKKVPVSNQVKITSNPLRNFVEKKAKRDPNHPKKFINFSLGDPTLFQSFFTEKVCRDAIADVCIQNPYAFCSTEVAGLESTRMFLASLFSTSKIQLHPDQVFLTNGGSPGLWVALRLLAGAGEEILIPSPGFPLPRSIMSNCAGAIQEYKYINSDGQWLIDIEDLRSKISDRTRGILINNPSNPLGTCLPRSNLIEVVKVAKEFKLPIITDEIYEDMVHPSADEPFISLRELADGVPVIVSSGLSKKYLMPGARLGWVILFGPRNIFSELIPAMRNVCSELRAAPSMMQCATKKIMMVGHQTVEPLLNKMERNFQKMKRCLKCIDGFSLDIANSAFYATISLQMERFDVRTTEDFALKLLEEENILCMPGIHFGKDSFLRLVICSSMEEFEDFCQRFEGFCQRHSVEQPMRKMEYHEMYNSPSRVVHHDK